ncbi:hypothetical protein [Pseudodesulfovibrio sp.]|uniref:DUF2059 domain-containing protein n=1 Tax=Pseudodesulfovibrio sp. TaxID=2035812 RepID=UPI00261EC2B1|nr:hypothetical protein [Pseudodesulfovibrio sp.]MDD3310637.1 hypothetical protein [Pseudodesulfovibrio sp.]
MKKTLILLVLFLASPVCAEEKPTPQEMMTMLKVSGAVDTVDQMMVQLLANLEAQVRREKPNLPKEAYPVIKDEFQTGMQAWLKTIFVRQMEYYSKSLTRQEVLDLTRMYGSEAYKKMLRINKDYISQALLPIMQKEVPAITGRIVQRVNERLISEGIIKNAEAGI